MLTTSPSQKAHRSVAQLVARTVRDGEVPGSSPGTPTHNQDTHQPAHSNKLLSSTLLLQYHTA